MAFNGRFILNMAYQAVTKGADLNDMLRLTPYSESELCSESCFVEDSVYNKILEKAVESSGDELFGLHAGEALNLSAAGLIAQIVQTSPTVKDALDYCCEFANLGCSALPMQLSLVNNQYKLSLTPDPVWKEQSQLAFRHTTEGVLAFTVKEFHSLTRLKYYPSSIHLPWERVGEEAEFKRVYNCPVVFGSDEIAMFFERSHIDQAIISSDYNLLSVLVAHAEAKSAELKSMVLFSDLVRKSIVTLVKPEFPSLEDVAGHLNISTRTLQRKLKEEGVVYKTMIDELKKDFAIKYLRRKDLNISDVAYLLSYSDVSSFSKAFKRWTGKSPSSYQK
jgi:AraC-like DNA-binding protein